MVKQKNNKKKQGRQKNKTKTVFKQKRKKKTIKVSVRNSELDAQRAAYCSMIASPFESGSVRLLDEESGPTGVFTTGGSIQVAPNFVALDEKVDPYYEIRGQREVQPPANIAEFPWRTICILEAYSTTSHIKSRIYTLTYESDGTQIGSDVQQDLPMQWIKDVTTSMYTRINACGIKVNTGSAPLYAGGSVYGCYLDATGTTATWSAIEGRILSRGKGLKLTAGSTVRASPLTQWAKYGDFVPSADVLGSMESYIAVVIEWNPPNIGASPNAADYQLGVDGIMHWECKPDKALSLPIAIGPYDKDFRELIVGLERDGDRFPRFHKGHSFMDFLRKGTEIVRWAIRAAKTVDSEIMPHLAFFGL